MVTDSVVASRDPFQGINNVVAIIDNDIYYFETLDGSPRQLTKTPTKVKTHVKLSADRTRIAYINEDGHPVIIRSDNGRVVQTLTQFDNITQMDWAKDRLTLYILIGQEVFTIGAPLDIIQPELTGPYDDFYSFSMNSIGDYGYFTHYFYGTSFRYHSVSKNVDEEYFLFDGDQFNYVDFFDDDGSFLLGYNDPNEDGMKYVVCVQKYNFRTAYKYEDDHMNTPEFNAKHEVLIYGTMENSIYQIKAAYLGTKAYEEVYGRPLKVIEGSASPIYLDWVQE